jgi:hypothetical protein
MSAISFLRRQSGFPDALDWSGFRTAIVESDAEIECIALGNTNDVESAQTYPVGVAFGPRAELRWRKRRDGLHVVLISDDGVGLPGAEKPCALRPVPEEQGKSLQCYLWGEWDGTAQCHVERRIPRPLRYPGQTGTRVVLRLKRYKLELAVPAAGPGGVETQQTVTRISRYTGIETAE